MSTSNPGEFAGGKPTVSGFETFPGLSELAPSGLSDVSVLTRLANEFFTALPGPSQPGAPGANSSDFTPLAQTPVTAPAVPSEVSLLSDQHFPSAPAGAGPAVAAPVTAPIQIGPPAVPGSFASPLPAQTAEVPAFSFLDEVRPIFAGAKDETGQAYPEAKPIAEFISAPPFQPQTPPEFDGDAFAHFPELFSPPSPTVPGTLGIADSSAIPAFSFLEEARPLFSSPPSSPGPVPAAALETPVSAGPQSTAQESGVSTDFAASPRKQPFGFLHETRSITAQKPPEKPGSATIEPDVPQELNLSSYSFDAEALRRDFPILRERVNGRPLVWLDNAATTQKPLSVIERLDYFYKHENSNVHRAAHELAARATDAYESAREKVRRFLNASSSREIVFVRGATEGINMVAQSWGRQNIQKDDEIVITWLEHHANIVPWQMLCAEKGARLRVVPVDSTGQVLLDEYEKLLGPKTRLVSFAQVSNALGVVTPAAAMIEAAHRHGAKVLLDGAQAVSHMRVDVQALDCDFFVFSGHKLFSPTGIGVVYGKPEVLEHMQPWQGGGNMIQDVTFERTIYQPAPQRFEAGTGNIADAVGLGAAIDYLTRAGMENISRHEHELLIYATAALVEIPGLRILGTAREKAGVLSFVIEGFRNEEIGDYLNRNGIAVRSGHHCAQPILRRFGLESTVRASLALYNTKNDIDALVTALWNLYLGRTAIA